jgi:hypothetical protein
LKGKDELLNCFFVLLFLETAGFGYLLKASGPFPFNLVQEGFLKPRVKLSDVGKAVWVGFASEAVV